jgi:predicted DNA-binding protein (MmcQ/YjbR family)
MELDRLHTYLLSLPGAVEERPFSPEIPVYKVMGRMFAYLSPDEFPPRLTLKLDPLQGQLLRAAYDAVRPGYHMNKDHWNTFLLDGSVPEEELLTSIDESYELVVSNLTRSKRRALEQLEGTLRESR